jgi:hypothetical protein
MKTSSLLVGVLNLASWESFCSSIMLLSSQEAASSSLDCTPLGSTLGTNFTMSNTSMTNFVFKGSKYRSASQPLHSSGRLPIPVKKSLSLFLMAVNNLQKAHHKQTCRIQNCVDGVQKNALFVDDFA